MQLVKKSQIGLTLVELLVSIALTGLISLAAISLYGVASNTMRTVDANQEILDSGRFALDQIGLAVSQAGYEALDQTGSTGSLTRQYSANATTYPSIQGANNAKVTSLTSQLPQDFGTNGNGGHNASDTLGVLFQGRTIVSGTTSIADPSLIDCLGKSKPYPTGVDDLMVSLFWVDLANGEPHLKCTRNGESQRETQPIVKGVETFQVMYGVGADPLKPPTHWKSANTMSTAEWRQIKMIRVGLVVRGAPGSAQSAGPSVLYPLGLYFTCGSTSTSGCTPEAGLSFTPPNDNRIRKVFSATFAVRNNLAAGGPT